MIYTSKTLSYAKLRPQASVSGIEKMLQQGETILNNDLVS